MTTGVGYSLDVAEYGAALDWITWSSFLDPDSILRFKELSMNLLNSLCEPGAIPIDCKVGAYYGKCVGDVKLVQREYDSHCLLIASGDITDFVARVIINHEIPGRPSRIDAQVTAIARKAAKDWPEVVRWCAVSERGQAGKGRRKGITLFDSASGASGLAIGSRRSAKFARIYDWDAKHAKRRLHIKWRFELEMKGISARDFWGYYVASNERAQLCCSVVKQFLMEANITLDFLDNFEGLSIVSTKKPSDADARMEYFKKVVLPLMDKMVFEGQTEQMKAEMLRKGVFHVMVSQRFELPELKEAQKRKLCQESAHSLRARATVEFPPMALTTIRSLSPAQMISTTQNGMSWWPQLSHLKRQMLYSPSSF